MLRSLKSLKEARSLKLALLTLGSALLALLLVGAFGEPPRAAGQDGARPAARRAGTGRAGSKGPAKGRRAEAPTAPEIEEDEDVDTDSEVDAESEMRNEKGGKVKVIRFSGLDLAGRLKSPQLLYFLSRMRTEFDRPRLPHRSFMPELQRSTKSKNF